MQYVVKPGDTLYTIAQRYGVTVAQIMEVNPQLTDPNLIYPGQTIIIPPSPSGMYPPGQSPGGIAPEPPVPPKGGLPGPTKPILPPFPVNPIDQRPGSTIYQSVGLNGPLTALASWYPRRHWAWYPVLYPIWFPWSWYF